MHQYLSTIEVFVRGLSSLDSRLGNNNVIIQSQTSSNDCLIDKLFSCVSEPSTCPLLPGLSFSNARNITNNKLKTAAEKQIHFKEVLK